MGCEPAQVQLARAVAAADLTGAELFEALMRNSIDGVVIADAVSGRILATSDSECRLTGYDRDELVGRYPAEVGLVSADDIEAAAARTERGQGGVYEFAMRRKRSGGSR